MKKSFLLLGVVLGLVSPIYMNAAANNGVVISEIAWMGAKNSANDEWIELHNLGSEDVDLKGWTLNSSDGKIKIHLKGFVLAHGFYLMERTNDDSVPSVPADMLYTGALGNSGQNLILQDSKKNIVDQASSKGKWLAGNNSTKQTMERIAGNPPADEAGWQTSKEAGGTPKAENSVLPILPKDQKTDTTYLSALSSSTQSSNPWILFLVALGIAVISAATLLIIKFKLFKHVRS